MSFRLLVAVSLCGIFGYTLLGLSVENPILSVWVSCEWTVVTRTNVGKLEISHVRPNTPDCRGPKVDVSREIEFEVKEAEKIAILWTTEEESDITVKKPWILLDLKQADIVAYRLEHMKQNQIRYANAIRSVRMRNAKSKESRTNAYLMKNDAVVVDGKETGWVSTQWAIIEVSDTRENTVTAVTTWKAKGYIAAKYLRDANPSDLVRIRQADNAYWSDVAHVNAERYLNVRSHPWMGAPIVITLGRGTSLYVVSTVDDWSEVISDDRSIRGYVKSKYLTIDLAQRTEIEPLLK